MMAYTVVLVRMASEKRVSPDWTTYRTHQEGGPQGTGVGWFMGRKILIPAKMNSFCRQFALAIAMTVVPEVALNESRVSLAVTSCTVHPSGMSPQRMSRGTAVGVPRPDEVAVGAGVLVGVERETAVAVGASLSLFVDSRPAMISGVGSSVICSRSICDINNAMMMTRITPLVMRTLFCQF